MLSAGKITEENKAWTLGCFSIVFHGDHIGFGWCLAEEFWGLGIMPETLNAVLNYVKNTSPDIKYAETLYHSGNKKSGRAMEKCGFRKSGEIHRPSTEDGHYGEDSLGIIMRKDL